MNPLSKNKDMIFLILIQLEYLIPINKLTINKLDAIKFNKFISESGYLIESIKFTINAIRYVNII